MPALREQDIRNIAGRNARVTEVRGKADRRVEQAALDFGGELFALFDARAQEVDSCFESCEGVVVVWVVLVFAVPAFDMAGAAVVGGKVWFVEDGHWFQEDEWAEALRDGSILHAFVFELPAPSDLAVQQDGEVYRQSLTGAPFRDWVEGE